MSLRLGDAGVEYQVLDDDTVPEVAKKLFTTMTELTRMHDIIPYSLQQTIAQKLEDRNRQGEKERWRYCFKPEGTPDDLPGRIPSFEEMEKVLRKTRECENLKHEEASWNSQVHLRLLESIFEDPLHGQCGDFNAISW